MIVGDRGRRNSCFCGSSAGQENSCLIAAGSWPPLILGRASDWVSTAGFENTVLDGFTAGGVNGDFGFTANSLACRLAYLVLRKHTLSVAWSKRV